MANISIIAGSLISKKPEFLAESLITNQLGIQNYFQSFSREQEREADFYGIETLNKLNISSVPLKKFLNLLEENGKKIGMKEEYYKFSTHPIFKERYNIIDNNSKSKNRNFDEKFNKRFNFIRAKLFGFTTFDKEYLKIYLKDDFLEYAQSIILSKQGKLKESMKLLNNVLKNNKDHTYIIETKADILYSNGYFDEAYLFYEKELKINKKNYYVMKRMFDIKFTQIDFFEYIKNTEFFYKYSVLLNIFYNNKNLNEKFMKIAIKNNQIEWANYLSINLNTHNENYENLIKKLNNIKKDTKDVQLTRLIDKKIKEFKIYD